MKELKLKYQKGTKTYTQIRSSCRAYIYEVKDSETVHIYYEVFERRYNRRFDCISYPTNKAFGFWAWCCSRGKDHQMALRAALKRFEFLSKQKEAA
ncbi:hypothetical protein [Flagellimonas myxillae]|uniref:hypothetical protein n=1 Tax=Flagellimonas myxillae TaxID=2942214 RepID=UPI00201E9269|nr:hypothetical protein [Muricauda myxillae]MCL6264925.1 hypothetical protein [Muricauda myxillae]